MDARNADGATPLIRAARWGHDDVAAVLLAHGAQAAATDSAGRAAADWAASKGHGEVSALLAGGMRVIDAAGSGSSSSSSGGSEALGHNAHALSVSPANASGGADHGPAPAAAAAGRPGLGGTALGHLPSIGESGDDDAEADAAEAAVAQYVLDEDGGGAGGSGGSAGADGGSGDDFRTLSDLGDGAAGEGFELGVPMHAEGWMAKQGQIFKTWKNRWFVLEGRCIYYYAREGAAKPKGVIVMSEGTDVIVEEKYAKPFCFTVATPAKRYILQAADEDEMAEWIEAIANNLECVPPGAVAGADAAEDGEDDD